MSSERPWVACLCAAWCVACREYGATFAALAAQLGADAAGARFFGPVMPQASTAERLIRGALAGGLAVDSDPALVAHVGALVPRRLVAPRPA